MRKEKELLFILLKNSFTILSIFLLSFLVLSCQKQEIKDLVYYYSPDKTYYQSEFYFDTPYIEKERFYFPFFSTTPNIQLFDMKFYYNETNLDGFTTDNFQNISIPTKYKSDNDIVFYKTGIIVNISYKNLSNIRVNKIELISADLVFPFTVDFLFVYDNDRNFTNKPDDVYNFTQYLQEVTDIGFKVKYSFGIVKTEKEFFLQDIEPNSFFSINTFSGTTSNYNGSDKLELNTENPVRLKLRNDFVIEFKFEDNFDAVFFNSNIRITIYSKTYGTLKFTLIEEPMYSYSVSTYLNALEYLPFEDFVGVSS
jgi:hypothetical protein